MNGWVNNPEAGDLRRNRAHYDVTVMETDLAPGVARLPPTIVSSSDSDKPLVLWEYTLDNLLASS